MDNNINSFKDLQDFNIEPSSQVWVDIEKQLPQEKKRRIVAWWWSLPILFIAGLTVWFTSKHNDSNVIVTNDKQKKQSSKPDNTSLKNNKQIVLVKEEKPNEVNESSLLGYKKNNLIKQFAKNENRKVINNKKTNLTVQTANVNDASSLISYEKNTAIDNNKIEQSKDIIATQIESLAVTNTNQQKEISSEKSKEIIEQKSKESDTAIERTTATQSKKDLPKLNKKLNWSLAFGSGINYLSKNNLFSNETNNVVTTGSLSSSPGSAQNNTLTLPKTGFNFNLGLNGNYQLSKKSTLQFGLHYNYFQNNLQVEPIPQTTVNLFDDLYRNGSMKTYKNYYHLIGVPVNYKYCLNTKANNKISAVFGFTTEYAIAKNWLYLDNEKQYYEKDNSKLSNVFVSLQTGLSIDFNSKLSVEILVKKYLNSIQKSSINYYWQQLNLQVNIPLKFKTIK